ncbi:sensor histidine kinase [Cellulosilyticum sp. WCF-2]|uniref:sensor histidine kinase n=1 Tax=Cellulosilyticum sp. WCF-2 TaxID=2497860 RepID=UPI000F8DEA03|nr:sensor histidine kinase [Cellulosilyticum sp. WCF-2]QEH67510.1 GHKL domain-containing protein [Cellulosilyticum sp. WCF-2]
MALIIDIISEWAICGIEFIIFIFTFNLFFELKDRCRGCCVVIGILYALIIAFCEIENIDDRILIYFFYIFGCCIYFFKGRIIHKVAVIFLTLSIVFIIEEIFTMLLSIVLKENYFIIGESKFLSKIVVQYVKLLVLLLVFKLYVKYISRATHIKRHMNKISKFQTSIFLIMPSSSLVILTIFFDTVVRHLTKVEAIIMGSAVMGCLLAFNIALLLLVYREVANKEAEYMAKNMQEQLKIQFDHYKQIEEINAGVRALKHDMKNHMLCLQTLLDNYKNDQAIRYLANITAQIETLDMKINTGDTIIDAVLQQKCKEAQKNEVILEIEGKFIGELPLEPIDKCTIISNALDNALEACLSIPDPTKRRIQVIIGYNKNYIFITVENSVGEKIKINNNTIKTSKNNKKDHGFGLENIKTSLRNYDGYFSIYYEEDTFVLEIVITI